MPSATKSAPWRAAGTLSCPGLLAAAAGIVAFAVLLDSWWVADDWSFLVSSYHWDLDALWGARPMSQRWYWHLCFPLFGLQPWGWALTRLGMHAAAAALVTRIAARCGLAPNAQALAGVLFATSTVVFTPLLWGSGVEELLGALLALVAAERWLAHSGRGALLWGAAAILSKESAFALPVVFAALVVYAPTRGPRRPWPVIVALVLVAMLEAGLVWRHFHVLQESANYALGSPIRALENMLLLAGFAVVPIKWQVIYEYQVGWRHLIGALVLGVWCILATWRWRREDRLPAAGLLAALASVAAALPLANSIHANYAYLAMAPATLTAAHLTGPWLVRRKTALLLLTAALVLYSGISAALRAEDENHFLVRSQRISRDASAVIRSVPVQPADEVVIVQNDNPLHRKLYSALGGIHAAQALLGPDVEVRWVERMGYDELEPRTHLLVEHNFTLRLVDLSRHGDQGFQVLD